MIDNSITFVRGEDKIIYFHWLSVEHERQQRVGHTRLSGAVLICL